MGRISTNSTGFLLADEAAGTPGTLPGSPSWYRLEPNTPDEVGATLTTTARRPISSSRQRRKGKSTALESGIKITMDATWWHFVRLLHRFLYTTALGGEVYDPASAVAASYTVAAGTALAAGSLVFGRGWALAANNGLNEVDTGATTTNIPIVGAPLATETAPAAATVEQCGVRGATGDLQIDANGDLISTILDFTTLPIEVGQMLHIGGLTSTNQFTTAGAGYGRADVIEANKVTLSRSSFAQDNGSGKRIDILFGAFLKNLPTSDAGYDERTQQVEISLPNLGPSAATRYEYSKGNLPDELAINCQLGALATIEATWVGTDTEVPTGTQKTNADSPIEPEGTDGMSTATDLVSLAIQDVDDTDLTTDIKSAVLRFREGVTGEPVLAQLGPRYLNPSLLEVAVEMQLVFTDEDVITRIRNNTTVQFQIGLKSDDGAVFFDIPSATLGGGGHEFPVDAGVLLNVTLDAFQDPTLGTSIGVSFFPTVP